MKGTTPTKAEKAFHDDLASLGCIACRIEGRYNSHVSIHHVRGRVRSNCHMYVLPICGPHHQDDGTAIAIHPWKARWEAAYGKQEDLVLQLWEELGVKNVA